MHTQVGKCNHCGACCYIYSYTLKRYHICEAYTTTNPNGRCSLYGSSKRPKECMGFPRVPADLERVIKYCCIRFIDEKGRFVDGMMDKTVKLTPLPK